MCDDRDVLTAMMTNILSIYDRFAFSILPCPMAAAREVIVTQSAAWGRHLVVDRPAARDVRLILNSPDGPAHPPAVRIGILLSEVHGPEGLKTLFVSNVADGYSSMVYMVSKRIFGPHLSVQLSNLSSEYPRNAFTMITSEKEIRVVYAMRDNNAWEFLEKGEPLSFENLNFYGTRRRRDRLTPDIISGYLAHFGYGSLDQDFWISAAPAHLLCDSEFRLWNEAPD